MSTLTTGMANYGCKKKNCYYCNGLRENQSSAKLIEVLNMKNTYINNKYPTEVITIKSKV